MTHDGISYAEFVSAALADLQHATNVISRRRKGALPKHTLVVTANSGFIDCWLSARISDFLAKDSDVELQLHYGEDMADYRHKDSDIAIHFSSIGSPGGDSQSLFQAVEFPVCSPELLFEGRRLTSLEDLRHVTLLHEHDRIGWRRWLVSAGVHDLETDSGPVFQNTQTIFNRVKACDGVGLADDFVAFDEISSGSLVKPLPIVRQSEWTVFLVQLRRDRSAEHVERFSEWMIKTVKEFRQRTRFLRKPKTFPIDWVAG